MGETRKSSKNTSNRKKTKRTSTKVKKTVNKSAPAVKKTVDKSPAFGDTLTDEIIIILIIVISIITIISLFSSSMGVVGSLINSFFKGLFGFSAYIMPVAVIGYCVWLLTSENKRFKEIKLIGTFLCIIFFGAIIAVFNTETFSANASVFEKMAVLYKNGGSGNGGLIGGIFGNLFASAFGKIGATIILIALLIISAIMATGKSFFAGVSGAYKYNKTKIREYKNRVERENYNNSKVPQNNRISKSVSNKSKQRKIPDFIIDKDDFNEEAPYVEETVFKKREPRKYEKAPKGIYDFKIEIEKDNDFPFGNDFSTSNTNDINNKDENKVYNDKNNVEEYKFFNDIVNEDFGKDTKSEEVVEIQKEVFKNIDSMNTESVDTELKTINNIDYDKNAYDTDTEAIEKAFEEMEKSLVENTDIESDNYTSNINNIDTEVTENIQPENTVTTQTNIETKQEIDTQQKTVTDDNSIKEFENSQNIQSQPKEDKKEYVFPPMDLLGKDENVQSQGSKLEMINNAKKLEETLKSFGVDAKVIQINRGPTVTRYELSPSQGVKVSKIVNLADDIALNLAAAGIRIEAPIPGKAAVGIEVPNKETQSVYLRTVLESDEFQNFSSKLAFALGEDIAGKCVVTDIAKMPHLLIAGATGSGKSVCINTLITSIIYKAKPEEVKLLLVDPKVVELSVYNGIPHLLIPVVTDPKKAASALNWAVREMLQRYNDFAEHNVRDIKGFNAMKKEKGETDLMPQIVIIIDELADLMMAAPGEVEDSICRLAQMARAAGLHLIIATQRPSVDVITGVIKANIPSRLAFAVSSGIDSRTILDTTGAEKLLGKGDMLFCPVGMSKPVRIQGAFVTDKEVENIVAFVKQDGHSGYSTEMIEEITSSTKNLSGGENMDEHFEAAIELVVKKEKASVSMLQRHFRIGYNRAANLMEALEDRGIVGSEDGSKPRKVLMSQEEYDEFKEQGGFNG